jgi:hypothetical protein
MADLHFEVPKHPDYHLLPNLKKQLKGRKFSGIGEAPSAADAWFVAQPKELFLNGLKEL